jgi:hypothetical protein
MFHWTRTTGLENSQDSILSEIETALVPITATAWKTAQLLIKRRHAVPSSERTRTCLNYLLGTLHVIFLKSSQGVNDDSKSFMIADRSLFLLLALDDALYSSSSYILSLNFLSK